MRFPEISNRLQKILEFVNAWAAQGKKIRGPTVEHLRKIREYAKGVYDAVNKILDGIELQDESYADMKFTYSSTYDPDNAILIEPSTQLQAHIVLLNQQSEITQKSNKTSQISIYSADEYKQSDSHESTDSTVKKERSAVSQKCIDALYAYSVGLNQLVDKQTNYTCVNKLSKLLIDWYNARIIDNRRYNSSFQYSHSWIEEWICGIVIAYGYHMEQGSVDSFIDEFYSWLRLLGKDAKVTDRFATPFDVYLVCKRHDRRFANMTALVLYDIIWEHGLIKTLEYAKSKGCYLISPYGVSNLMYHLDVDIVAEYADKKDNTDMISEVGINIEMEMK